MSTNQNQLLTRLLSIAVQAAQDHDAVRQQIADLIRADGTYRWVGLYRVDYAEGFVRNLAWSGPGAPEYPTFPITKGLTAAAIAGCETINVGDVAADPRYLTAFGSTRSEIIIPIFNRERSQVVGTIDVESEQPNAFNQEIQSQLEACAQAIASQQLTLFLRK
jgi:GAF domain-containing protein